MNHIEFKPQSCFYKDPDYHLIDGFELEMVGEFIDEDDSRYHSPILGCIDSVNDANRIFFSVYQHYDPDKSEVFKGVDCLRDFDSRSDAEKFMQECEAKLKEHQLSNNFISIT